MQEKNELFSRLAEIKKEVNALRDRLNELDQQKESWFQKKEEYSKKIRYLISQVKEKNNNLHREIGNFKKESEALHQTIQKTAKESQSAHEGLIANSKEIDELKLKEREAFSKFFEFKKNFAEINNALKDKLKDFSVINSEIHKIKHEKEEKIIRDKEEFIQEKIRKGQKLTNEDLLIFQT